VSVLTRLAADLQANAVRLARDGMIENARVCPENLFWAACCGFLAEMVRGWAERG
jgi:hypothetical protein